MTTTSNAKNIAEKIQSFAMGFIGSMFIALGFSYFSEQASYRIPRILLPIYNLLGNVGLAIGLLILGAILLFASYSKFKRNARRPTAILIILPLFVIFSLVITHLFENKGKNDTGQLNPTNQKSHNTDSIKEETRPTLDNVQANEYLDQVERIVQEMSKSKAQKDDKAFEQLESQYFELTSKLSNIIPDLSKTDKYPAFAHYNAYLANKINKMRGL